MGGAVRATGLPHWIEDRAELVEALRAHAIAFVDSPSEDFLERWIDLMDKGQTGDQLIESFLADTGLAHVPGLRAEADWTRLAAAVDQKLLQMATAGILASGEDPIRIEPDELGVRREFGVKAFDLVVQAALRTDVFKARVEQAVAHALEHPTTEEEFIDSFAAEPPAAWVKALKLAFARKAVEVWRGQTDFAALGLIKLDWVYDHEAQTMHSELVEALKEHFKIDPESLQNIAPNTLATFVVELEKARREAS